MTGTEPLNVAQVLKQYGLRASKGLGQNFLEDPEALGQIAAAAAIAPSDIVLEIGPGLGSLTRFLAISAHEVVAVELDSSLLPILRKILKPYPNVRLVQGDILKMSAEDLHLRPGYIVAANIPYNITSILIRHLLEGNPKPRRLVLTVQQEVAQRICAQPPRMSLLSLSVQVYGVPELVARIPAEAFYPAPKVDSAVVRIEVGPEPAIPFDLLPVFFQLSKACFAQKRKTLRNAFSAGVRISADRASEMLRAAGIDPQRRAETLSLEEWGMLAGLWSQRSNSAASPSPV